MSLEERVEREVDFFKIECVGLERASPFLHTLVFGMPLVANRFNEILIVVRTAAVVRRARAPARDAPRVCHGRISPDDRFEGNAVAPAITEIVVELVAREWKQILESTQDLLARRLRGRFETRGWLSWGSSVHLSLAPDPIGLA